MITVNASCWSVRFTLPADTSKGRRWKLNCTWTVVANTAERAIELLREANPDATVFNVNHKGGDETVWDPVLVAAAREEAAP